MDEVKVPLVINKLQSKEIYDYLASNGSIGLNELYLIQNDEDLNVTSVSYDSSTKKLYYTDMDGNNHDIVTTAVLKSAMGLSGVATSGSYDALSSQPKINGVTLSGNKTTSDLNISYNDLTSQPTIPTVTSNYSSSDTANALNGVAVNTALSNYVQKSVSVTGTGALGGGGTLTGNITITHNSAPTGLSPTASKVAVDTYGHVQLGAAISAEDVGATPITYQVTDSCSNIDGGGYGTIVINASQSESISFSTIPTFGRTVKIYYMNNTDNALSMTINPSDFSSITHFYLNGNKVTAQSAITVNPNKSVRIDVVFMQYTVDNEAQTVCFADIVSGEFE